MRKRGLCRHAVSVRPSGCLLRSCILSKRINVSSKFCHHRVATPSQFFRTKRYGNIPTGTPHLTWASNAGGIGKNRDSPRIWATFHYSSQLQTWSKTWFSIRFSTSSARTWCINVDMSRLM